MEKKIKQPGYYILLVTTILFTVAGIITTLPDSSASKLCHLGYNAHCTFTPFSTIICLLFAGISCFLRVRFFKK